MRSGDSECSADVPASPRSPFTLKSLPLVERTQSTTDSQGDDQAAANGLQMTRQSSVSSAVCLHCILWLIKSYPSLIRYDTLRSGKADPILLTR